MAASMTATLDLRDLWSKLLEAVGRASQFARSYLLEAHPVSIARNVFTIGYDPQFADHLGLVDNPKNRALLQTKLRELGWPDLQLKFIQAEPPADWARASVAEAPPVVEPAPAPAGITPTAPAEVKPGKPVAMSKEDFKNDPLIKQALEIFKGQIVEVRS